MIRILGNDNNYFQETFAAYQIDQVVLVKKFLEKEFCPDGGQKSRGRPKEPATVREISDFLGEKNWSKSKVADKKQMAVVREKNYD